MDSQTLELPIKKPVALLQREVKLDAIGFFKALSKGIGELNAGMSWKLAPTVTEALTAIGLKPLTPEQRAWALIYKALLNASHKLVKPSIIQLQADGLLPKEIETRHLEELSVALDDKLNSEEAVITEDFFLFPERFSLLPKIEPLLEQWLNDINLPRQRARTVAPRLRDFFLDALYEEWRQNADNYTQVRDFFYSEKNLFTIGKRRQAAWKRHYGWLRYLVQDDLFGETFSLEQVYVPLRAYYEESKKSDEEFKKPLDNSHEQQTKRFVVDLEKCLNNWVQARETNDTLRMVSGGPGSGKSSFAKMWAARVAARSGWVDGGLEPEEIRGDWPRVLFVPLHQFDYKSDLKAALSDFMRSFALDTSFEGEGAEDWVLLVFDGLDEVSMRGKAAEEAAREFVDEVIHTIAQWNRQTCRVQALITGRDLAVQSNSGKLRKSGQLLRVLPYVQNGEDLRASYQDPQKLLRIDQRDLWWEKYENATGANRRGIPEVKWNGDLKPINAEPLLNYLLALSLRHGKLDFTQEVNVNQIYNDLLESVHNRDYEKRKHEAVRDVPIDAFRKLLEEIAAAIWHGTGRTATRAEIEKHCRDSNVWKYVETFEKNAASGVTRLLVSFFFREFGRDLSDNEKTIEFTHKSFGEYLTAKRIVRFLASLCDLRQKFEDGEEGGWDKRTALEKWATLCGPTAIDDDLLPFLEREIIPLDGQENGKELAKIWQDNIVSLLSFGIRNGLPMEKFTGLTHLEMSRQSRNAEEALLAMHCLCAQVTGETGRIDWPDSTSAANWLNRLDFKKEQGVSIYRKSLSYLSFDECNLHHVDLGWINLRKCSFRAARLMSASLHLTVLKSADFQGSELWGIDLRGADLEDAQLQNAILGPMGYGSSESGLEQIFLENPVKLEKANLRGANLSNARLDDADLRDADLRDAILTTADLSEADLTGAQWLNANLEGANLRGAKGLTEEELEYVQSRGAILNAESPASGENIEELDEDEET